MPSTASACHRRATVLALAISTVLLPLAGVPTAQAQPAVVAPLRQYAIPEQPLADAVRAFGRQADAQVVFRSDLVEGRRSSAVSGEYSQMQALQQLLRGSGVRAQRGMDGTWSLRAAAEAGEGEGVRVTETLDVAETAVTDSPFPLEPTAAEAQTAIAEEFGFFGDWSERYQYLIDLGRKLPAFPEEWKTEEHRLLGCQSMVWIVPEGNAQSLRFHAISDSAIVSGLIFLALRVYSGRSAQEILDTEPSYIQDIGLARHLSPTRSNGVAAMLAFIRETAQAQLQRDPSLLAYRIFAMLSYQVVAVTVGWHIYEVTRNPFSLGLVGLAEVLPFFCVAPFAGYLVDHLPRRRLGMVACSGLIATALVLTSVAKGWLPFEGVWPIYAAIALTGMVRAFLSPIYNALPAWWPVRHWAACWSASEARACPMRWPPSSRWWRWGAWPR
ncbi:hypothetical protein G6F31_013516 [Rhizopus arrhizus]|nr:hypothetical protein G6F31_013516 [Rhizopus arrhizus]